MFATISGAFPLPPGSAAMSPDERVRAVVEAQDAAGLELLTDGRVGGPLPVVLGAGLEGVDVAADGSLRARALPSWRRPITVAAWRLAASATEREVKQSLPGPYSLARLVAGDFDRSALTNALADAINAEARALADAGCPFVEIEESTATLIGTDDTERATWREAHARVTGGLADLHLSLAIVGGNADAAGPETILAAPYSSHLFDLVAGPDNWRLVTRTPPGRGIVVGALAPSAGGVGVELLAWAAHYAASTGGRGLDRVALANAPGLDDLPWDAAVARLEALGRTAGLVRAGSSALAGALDPRAISTRSAAAGTFVARPRRRRRRAG